MGKEYIVQTATCLCKYGAALGILKVTDQKGIKMNGKLVATSNTLGNVFNPPGFGVCKKSWPSRPCSPMVSKWNGFYEGVTINGGSPLTDTSKGTCTSGSPDCITFQTTGQVVVPGEPQMLGASVVQQSNLDPLGSPFGLVPGQEDYEITLK